MNAGKDSKDTEREPPSLSRGRGVAGTTAQDRSEGTRPGWEVRGHRRGPTGSTRRVAQDTIGLARLQSQGTKVAGGEMARVGTGPDMGSYARMTPAPCKPEPAGPGSEGLWAATRGRRQSAQKGYSEPEAKVEQRPRSSWNSRG